MESRRHGITEGHGKSSFSKRGYNNNIWFRGGDLNGFWDIWPFITWRGLGIPLEDPSLSLNVSYHKEQEYIWFRGGDLSSFYYAFYDWRGWDIILGDPRSMSLNASYYKKQGYIYGLGVVIWTVSKIWGLLWNDRVRHTPKGPLVCAIGCVLS